MKVVIVEDRPWLVSNAIEDLQSKYNVDIKVIYYPNKYGNAVEKDRRVAKLYKLMGIDVLKVSSQEEFVTAMESEYSISDTVFLMEYDLTGDITLEDWQRVNLRYFNSKEDKSRMWIYSTMLAQSVMQRKFGTHVLNSEMVQSIGVVWSAEDIEDILTWRYSYVGCK